MANKETTRVSAHVDRVLDASVVPSAGAGALGSGFFLAGAGALVFLAGAGAAAAGVAGAGLAQHTIASEVAHAAPAQSVEAAALIKAPV